MKKIIFLLVILLVYITPHAQLNLKAKRSPTNKTTNAANTNREAPANTNNKPANSNVDSSALKNTNNPPQQKEVILKDLNLQDSNQKGEPAIIEPIESDPSDTTILGDPGLKSLRQNYSFVNDLEDTAYTQAEEFPLEEQRLRYEDAIFSEMLIEEIDAREKINLPFIYKGKDIYGNDQRLFALLLTAIIQGGIQAFDASVENADRFIVPLKQEELRKLFKGTKDVQLVTDPVTGVTDTQYIYNDRYAAKPDSIYIYRLKTHYVFDKKTSVFYKRILGIAPVARYKNLTGSTSTNAISEKTLFWVYYPDVKNFLSKQYAYNPYNLNKKMTWEELLTARLFSSYIIKSSNQNITDEKISSLIKDPYLRLLKSETIKNRIYDWESDRWEY
ncbi:MAG: gliding motility protein GldN [Sediminibacterium sp.]|nr:gliding motility protein GldN [Sediminibacterium sp.]